MKFNTRELMSQGKISNPSEFTMQLDSPLNLGSLNYKIGLYSVDCWNTAKNCVNETLRYSINSVYFTYTIPDGFYSIELLNAGLQVDIVSNGGTTGAIQLLGDYAQNRVVVSIDNTLAGNPYTLDLATSTGIANLLGFPEAELSASATGTSIANFSRNPTNYDPIDSWQIETNLISGSYENGTTSRIIFSFIPAIRVGSKVYQRPLNIPYFQIAPTVISDIYIALKDNRGNLIDLGGEHLNVIFEITTF